MARDHAETIKALVLSHDARDLGGVGNFIRILKQRLRPTTTIRRFINGRRAGESGKVMALKRMAGDYLRFAVLVIRERFDLYHFNPEMDVRSFPREALFMLILILLGRRNFIIFFRGWNWDEFHEIDQRPWLRRLCYLVLKRASRVVVLSESFRQALIEKGLAEDQVLVMTTMFDGRLVKARRRFAPETNPETTPETIKAPVLLFMARFVVEKGVYQLLDAINLLKQDYPGITLVMGGDGPEMTGLQTHAHAIGIADHVSFPGYVRRDQKAQVFDDATLFVFPSYFWEGLPNAVLEAMGAGLPILANPIAGVPEVMSAPENGLFLEEVTAGEIAAKLKTMLDDPDYLAKTSTHNVERAWNHYESAVVSRRIEDVYRSVRDETSLVSKPAGHTA